MRMRVRSWADAHRGSVAVIGLATIGFLGLGVYWFAPQNLFVDRRVDEALPGLHESSSPAGPVVVSRSSFGSLEHATTGSALVVELADGSHVIRLEDLATSNGPDVRVILSDRPVSGSWHGWTDGEHLDLGALKGNIGSANYPVPIGVDPADYRTVVVWCRRFTVGFGVAPIALR